MLKLLTSISWGRFAMILFHISSFIHIHCKFITWPELISFASRRITLCGFKPALIAKLNTVELFSSPINHGHEGHPLTKQDGVKLVKTAFMIHGFILEVYKKKEGCFQVSLIFHNVTFQYMEAI